uniref:Short chain dehydrogenase/reductase family 39U, member 1 n=2 Tax=Cyprinus carpio TaxID=7962 RepID=A0A9J8C5P8_CYPCA
MRVEDSGGSGFVGRELTRLLKSKGHEITIISRQPGPGQISWADVESREGAVNVAGENIMNPLRWYGFFFLSRVSRVKATKILAQDIAASPTPPHSWVFVTGVDLICNITKYNVINYISKFVKIEKKLFHIVIIFYNITVFTVSLIKRLCAVLGRDGGTMKQMLIPFWLGLDGTLGSGRQPFPWIDVSDLVGIITYALEPKEGPPSTEPDVFNGVSPSLNTNFEFTKALGRSLKRRTIFPVPGFFLDVFLGSERAVILTQGQKVVPKKTLESGFVFQYPDLTSALKLLDIMAIFGSSV